LQCFDILMIPQPPISTLFPYTTLFRSTIVKHISADRTKYVSMITEESEEAFSVDLYKGNSATGNYQLKLLHQNKEVVTKDVVWKDRKSTRLNSSHVKISYAVFCLKKKK